MKTQQFGVHLTIDGYGGEFEKLNDKFLVYDFLDVLPTKIGMKKIIEPVVKECEAFNEKDSGGCSGIVMIAESHISIHTFPFRGFVSIDVYTCKNKMAKQYIINYVKKLFKLKEVEVNFIKRGTRFPTKDL